LLFSWGPPEFEYEIARRKRPLYCCSVGKATVWALWPERTPEMIFTCPMRTKI